MKKIPYILMVFVMILQARRFGDEGFMMRAGLGDGPPGNSIIEIVVRDRSVWVGGGEGVSVTRDVGETWLRFDRVNGIGKGGISALDFHQGVVWAATGFDTLTSEGSLPAGGGVGYSLDSGETWTWFRQPMEDRNDTTIAYKPVTTNVQNLTYDLAIADSLVWITSFAGGLRKTGDMGETWELVTVDGIPSAPLQYLTHRAFAVRFDGEILWVGTAGGISKSADGGQSWVTFNRQNQTHSISGNFVVALEVQQWGGHKVVWAATWPTTVESKDESEFKAVSYSEDGGLTWQTTLDGESVHNFAFHDSVVYAASDNGLFKSADLGKTWAMFPVIHDAAANHTIYESEINTVGAGPGDALWVGTSDGLGLTLDQGLSWSVMRNFVDPGQKDVPDVYASPNPFSPYRHHQLGGDGHMHFVYQMDGPARVTVNIYDFGMNRVTTLDYQAMQAGTQSEPVWNGKNDLGDVAANGVYFYELKVHGKKTQWGKVVIAN